MRSHTTAITRVMTRIPFCILISLPPRPCGLKKPFFLLTSIDKLSLYPTKMACQALFLDAKQSEHFKLLNGKRTERRGRACTARGIPANDFPHITPSG